MEIQSVAVLASASRHLAARARHRLERRLARFCPRLQPQIRALAARHPYLADLALSFPALLFTLAVPRHNAEPEPVIVGVIQGQPLAGLARAAGLPMWLRALPPEAFTRSIGGFPDSPLVRLHIANLIPASPKALPGWLDAVEQAYDVSDEQITLWVAGEFYRDPHLAKDSFRIRRTCLWAWFGSNALTSASGLIAKPWQASMTFHNARIAADEWLTALDLSLTSDDAYFEDTWLEPVTLGQFNFVPLKTPRDFAEESAAMENCLDWYGKNIQRYGAKVWSVRNAANRVATIELRKDACGLTYVYQLCGRKNDEPDLEVRAAVAQWMRTAPRDPEPVRATQPSQNTEQQAWVRLWRPYWLAKRKIPRWLPLQYSEADLCRLRFRR